MKHILIDTNIILDLLAKRKDFYHDSRQIFALADKGKIQLYISALSIANSYYILNDILKIKQAREILAKFKVLVHTISLSDKIIDLALNDSNFKDFEDGIQFYSAIESRCGLIITRNIKDFKKSSIPVLRPNEFLSKRKTGK